MLSSTLIALLSGEATARVRRLKSQMIILSILGGIALVGLMFLMLAGYLCLAAWIGPVRAALWVGGSLVAVAILGYLIYRLTAGARSRRRVAVQDAQMSALMTTTALSVLPVMASRAGAMGLVLAPFLAAVGYRIYEENTRPREPKDPETPAPDDESGV